MHTSNLSKLPLEMMNPMNPDCHKKMSLYIFGTLCTGSEKKSIAVLERATFYFADQRKSLNSCRLFPEP
jgi:hypothetical protein